MKNSSDDDVEIKANFVFVYDSGPAVFQVRNICVDAHGATWEVVTPYGDYREVFVPIAPPRPFVGSVARRYLLLARRLVARRLWGFTGVRERGIADTGMRCQSR